MKPRAVLSWRWLVALVAAVAIAAAAVAAYQSGLFPAAVRGAIDEFQLLDSRVAMGLGVGGILLGYAVVARWMKAETESPRALSEHRLEDSERETRAVDHDLMAAYEAKTAGDHSTDDPFQERLRAVLVAAYARELGSEDAAESHIDEGRWTTDVYAAAYLSSTDAVDYPWLHRLYGWLYPGPAYQRRVTRALRAVERACDVRLVSYTLPELEDQGPSTLPERIRARLGLEGDAP